MTSSEGKDRGEEPHTLAECRRCELWREATQAVGGLGPRRARIVLVGEQPGDEEDRQGVPFVGPAGMLLDTAFQAAGLDRKSVYLTNAVKHFKHELRGERRMHKTPAQREIEACRYWLEREIERVRPLVIVALGATALRAVYPAFAGSLASTVGSVIEIGGRWLLPTYHPSYALRLRDEAERKAALTQIVDALQLGRELVERDEKT